MANPVLQTVPLTLALANQFVTRYHRHNKAVPGSKYACGVADQSGLLRGVVIVGRPVARFLDNGWTLEVTRVVTDGCPNACSLLYGVARRIGFLMGYRKMITYTLTTETGSSLRGAGWCQVADVPVYHRGWRNRPGRIEQPLLAIPKYRWETLNEKQDLFSFSSFHVPWEESLPEKDKSHEYPAEYLFG